MSLFPGDFFAQKNTRRKTKCPAPDTGIILKKKG